MTVRVAVALPLLLLCACGGGAPAASGNDAQRQEQLIQNQAEAIRREAESNASAVQQALENETAQTFENRDQLLNQSANSQNDAAAANKSR